MGQTKLQYLVGPELQFEGRLGSSPKPALSIPYKESFEVCMMVRARIHNPRCFRHVPSRPSNLDYVGNDESLIDWIDVGMLSYLYEVHLPPCGVATTHNTQCCSRFQQTMSSTKRDIVKSHPAIAFIFISQCCATCQSHYTDRSLGKLTDWCSGYQSHR